MGWKFWERRHNTRFTSTQTIVNQMNERRPLPMGKKEFHEWSDRIIAGAMIPGATVESQKFALADQLLHLGPTESHKEDAFFIHVLRKFAVNQVADAMRHEIRDEAKARLAKEEEEAKLKLVPPQLPASDSNAQPSTNEPKVLADKSV